MMGIASNTSFVPGAWMEKFLTTALSDLPHHTYIMFAGMVFSDEVGCAKPAHQFFEHVNQCAQRSCAFDVLHSEILHVGDSFACDVIGATNFGVSSLLITNPDDLATQVIAAVNQQ